MTGEGSTTFEIREAHPDEYAAIGELTAEAYRVFPEVADDAAYLDELRDVGRRAAVCLVLVAIDERGTVLGGATYVPGPDNSLAEMQRDGEAGIRMLAVAPEARGRGVGTALTDALIERAVRDERTGLGLFSLRGMTDAHRMYERAGFRRAPDRDWEYEPGRFLLAFELDLRKPRARVGNLGLSRTAPSRGS